MARQRELLLTAKTADKFDLYQRSVQRQENVRFLKHRFHILTGRPLGLLREDFCGTAFYCCEFVKLHPKNYAIGIDLDGSALRWCLGHNYPKLKESQRGRITLIKGNVLTVETSKVDMIAVLNHSHGVFKNRSDLLRYLKKARRSLVKGGVIIFEEVAGADLLQGYTFQKGCGEFSLVSECGAVDPITHDFVIKLSYDFKDGSSIRNAFSYDFRLWTLPELQDLLLETGFENVHVIWGYPDRTSNSKYLVFRRAFHARSYNYRGWYAFVLGQA